MSFGIEHVTEGRLVPLGYQQITALSAAAALTVPAGARLVICQATVSALRWRDDGGNPTASIGMLLSVNYEIVYTGDLTTIKFIESAAGGVLNVSYYR